ncbi:aldehyde dehydrogenase family protein [Rhodococcus opacus]|uniref:Aldehyde dehydrogenase family protein n=1 Tax=Rhodococcus opacus TaxID=37919 RepID=A0ABT4NS57_RHOOP|nr:MULTISPECIES: aldehyde dehydrogenase family protein [Rhodococcus]MCZ4589172.1 aldehyde dehydrogenase family protein [Rhodococcus opacus]WKN60835.1 aldehyde dehydrogenase family protein [Rhodococcus opacus]
MAGRKMHSAEGIVRKLRRADELTAARRRCQRHRVRPRRQRLDAGRRRAHSIAHRLRAGRIGINVHRAGGVQMPVGGYKQSGWGRENGAEALDEYLETRSVVTRISD